MWIRRFIVLLAAVIFELCLMQSFRASLNLHIGLVLLGPLVHTAWLTETIPFIISVCCACALAWLLPDLVSRRTAIGFIALTGGVAAVWLAAQPPSYSMDILRYLWDGRLLVHGVSPYQYVPADSHLQAFRNWPYWRSMAWKQWPEAYPPLAQAYFFAARVLTNGSASGFKMLVVLNGLVSGILMLKVLQVRREVAGEEEQRGGAVVRSPMIRGLTARDVRLFALFNLFPPILTESYGAGHVDALAIPWLLWAWVAAMRRQPVRLGFAIACASALKLYPVVLLAAFWDKRHFRDILVSALSFVVTLTCILLPTLSNLHGFLAYYTKVSQMDYNGSLELILVKIVGPLVDAHSMWLVFLTEVLLWLLVVFTRLSKLPTERKASLLGLTFLLASPLLHPWYLLSLMPFAVAGMDLAALWLALSAHFTYTEVPFDMYIEYIPTYILYFGRIGRAFSFRRF